MQLTSVQLKEKLLHDKEVLLADFKTPDLSNNKCSLLDSIDQASVLANRANDCAIHSHKVSQLQKIENALDRIDSNNAFNCVDCEQDISARLLIVPETERCVACQTQHDKAGI